MHVLRPSLFVALSLGTTIVLMSTSAEGAPPQGRPVRVTQIDCSAFVRNADGSWTSTVRTYVTGRNARQRIDPATRFVKGAEGPLGLDIAISLEQACRLY